MAENWWEEDEIVSSEETSETSSEDNWWEEDESENEVEDKLLQTVDVGLNMYDDFETDETGSAFEKASTYFENLVARNPDGSFVNPDVSLLPGADTPDLYNYEEQSQTEPNMAFNAYLYTDPNTGERNVINPPSRSAFGDKFGFAGDDDPTVSLGRKIVGGISESFNDGRVLGGALIDKTAENIGLRRGVVVDTDFTERAQEKKFGVKTDDLGDSLIVDGLPALLAALLPGTAVYKGFQGVTNVLKNAPKIIQLFGNVVRGAPAALTGEFFATATVGTEEDTLLFGEGKVFGDIADLTMPVSYTNLTMTTTHYV